MRLASCILALLAAACGSSVGTEVPSQASPRPDAFAVGDVSFTGPITGGLRGHPMWDSWYDLAELGYVEEEYFASGTARQQPDGSEAEYVTRIIVRRPQRASHFNGTVVLDWVNVTAQFENAVSTLESHDFLIKHGYAFVHVSAQSAGLCCTPLTPKVWDPQRYGPLMHPGDAYAFDMFAQIAKGLRSARGTDPMGGLQVRRVIAAGQSQSGIRLHDYIDRGYARSGVIDGFLIHSDVNKPKSFAELPVPVLHLLSDFEAVADEPMVHPNYVLWEIAGSAHSDFWIGYHQEAGQGPRVLAGAPRQPAAADYALHETAGNYGEQAHPMLAVCTAAGAAFPMRYAVNAAFHYLHQWTGPGRAPPRGPRFAFDAAGELARDEFGNALGGIRYPPIDVPVASYQSTACALGGITVPFPDPALWALYPTHSEYFCRMKAATQHSVMQGYLMADDAFDLLQRALRARHRWPTIGVPDC